jgi:FkbM family methyltransferase
MIRAVGALLPDALKWKARKWLWTRLNPQWQLRSGIVVRVLNYNDWMIYNDIFVDGEYNSAIEQLLNSTSHDQTVRVLDLGGNVGFFTLRLTDAFLQANRSTFEVVMVEGSPTTFAELQERLRANDDLLGSRVRAVHGLAGERTGSAQIAETPSHGENTLFASGGKRTAVPFLDVEQLIATWPRVDLLKCDIEGAEELFLNNYPELLRRIDRAVFEFHHDKCDIPRCRALLAEGGLHQSEVVRQFGTCSVELFAR